MNQKSVSAAEVQPQPISSVETIDEQVLINLDGLRQTHPDVYQHLLRQMQRAGGQVVLEIPPHLIRRSKYANRDEASFKKPEFVELRDAIQQRGGNTVPIIVRPGQDIGNELVEEDKPLYEIVAGHRRHQACRELGIKVKAIVMPIASDVELTQAMYDENHARASLTPWESGCMYKSWMADCIYSSQNKLAAAIGRSAADVSRAISLADLDERILCAFDSPLVLQYKDADELRDLLKLNAKDVLEAAAALGLTRPKKGRAEVLRFLREVALHHGAVGSTNASQKTTKGKSRKTSLQANNAEVGKIEFDSIGKVRVVIDRALSPESQKKLEAILKKFVATEAHGVRVESPLAAGVDTA